ncbi:hypothetical protein MM01_00044 [Escherichia phage vB_EcoS_MM01]|uniref:Phage tail protein C-terminal domain-containing protein n=1 Tax=Escherichia phage vB_EcoS_MM01 TaxID=2508188 RepID=A0A482N5Z1_9CAUD|nr:hypothetical protein MM01_00044 [Escherichia phage vB_EcoS_MM01]
MAIYDLGTASLAANGEVTGVGTSWKAPLTLIRVGATIVFKTEPVKIYTISEIISDTQINVYNPNSETVPAGTGYAILAHDGITVQGLAQDVAETLRYYQSRETEVASAVDAFNDFDADEFQQSINTVNAQFQQVATDAAQVSADRAIVSADKDAAAASAASALSDSNAAAASAAEAADSAASVNASNLLRVDRALSDILDKPLARTNIEVYSKAEVNNLVSRFEQGQETTYVDSGSGNYKFFVGEADWGYFYNPSQERIALPLISGGTGATTDVEASNNINSMYTKHPATVAYGSTPMRSGIGFYSSDSSPYPGGNGAPYPYAEVMTIAENGLSGNYSQIGFSTITEGAPRFRQRFDNPARLTDWRDFFVRDLNTTVDSNGFIKIASPIVKVFGDGSFEISSEAEGCEVERISEGVYLISGCTGLNSDAAWGGVDGGFEVPVDINKQPRIWIDYSVNEDGSIKLKTYHRVHEVSPAFASNKIDGYSDGDPIDIPKDSFVSVRVNM